MKFALGDMKGFCAIGRDLGNSGGGASALGTVLTCERIPYASLTLQGSESYFPVPRARDPYNQVRPAIATNLQLELRKMVG